MDNWREGRRVAVVGAGPGGLSAAIASKKAGHDVRIFERAATPKSLGGAVLRHYGIDIENSLGSKTVTHFVNNKGKVRTTFPFNRSVEEAFGIEGWHYGILRDLLDYLADGERMALRLKELHVH